MTEDLGALFSVDGDSGEGENEGASKSLASFFASTSASRTLAAVQEVLADVEQGGGVATVDWLTESGHGEGALTAALSKPEGDKRKQPLLRAHNIDGVWVVALTSSGWTALGHPNKREQRPTPSTIKHRTAPMQIRKHVEGANAQLGGHITLKVETTQAAITSWQISLTAKAWGMLQSGTQTDQAGSVGQLTRPEGCPRPDALIYEEWGEGMGGRRDFWGATAPQRFTDAIDEHADGTRVLRFVILTHILEVETSEKRTHALTAKVQRLNAALDLGGADTVIWAVDSDNVAQRIRSAVRAENLGQDDPRHRIVPLGHLDGSAIVPPIASPYGWWASQYVPRTR